VEKEHYVVNRDSAYADPRIALKKLVGGNKRFIEEKVSNHDKML
jgi:carbonic anhydrase